MVDTSATNNEDNLPQDLKLAYLRTHLSLERTHLSWVQASLSLISFGFTISQVFLLLREKQIVQAPLVSPGTVAIVMISIGLLALILAVVQHRRALRVLSEQCRGMPSSFVQPIAFLLILLGAMMLLGAIFRR